MQISPEIINENLSKEYTVVRLCRDNLGDLAKLHAAVYNVDLPPGYFTRKYDTAYTGVSNVGFVAYNRENLAIAYYGVIPCFIQHGNKIILAAQSADTMTHPQHRYKGMFVELSNMTFELCRELGILFVFGFPNQNSYHGAVNKLGWQMTGTMSYFIIPVKSLSLEAFSRKSALLRNLYRRYFELILGKKLLPQQGLPNSVVTDGYAGVYRSEEYLGYKSYSPGKIIKVDDVKFWISDKPGLLIGDIEGLNATNFVDVIRKLKRLAGQLGIRQIQFHCSPGTTLHNLFEAHYQPAPSYPMLFQDFGSTVSPANARFSFADIDIF